VKDTLDVESNLMVAIFQEAHPLQVLRLGRSEHRLCTWLEMRPARSSQKQSTAKERTVAGSLLQLAGGESKEYVEEDFVFCVLNCLGLLRLDGVGDCKPTALLQETVEAIFDR
jgi:hypothetical protein